MSAKRRKMKRASLQLFGAMPGIMETREQRLNLAAVLALSANEDMRRYAQGLAHTSAKSAVSLAHDFRITWEQIAKEYEEIKTHEGRLRQADLIPARMEEIAIDCATVVEECIECSGTGMEAERDENKRVIGKRKCRTCRGKGTVRILGDTERLKMFLKNANIIKDRAPIENNVNTVINAPTFKLEDVAQMLDRKPSPPILEGE